MDIETTNDETDRSKQTFTHQKITTVQKSNIDQENTYAIDRENSNRTKYERDGHANRATQTSHGETTRKWRGRQDTDTKPSKNACVDTEEGWT